MKRMLCALLIAGTATLGAGPAFAQADPAALAQAQNATAPTGDNDTGSERVNAVIVYGNDPCPKSTGDEITVCARKAESERYRIPEPFRGPNPDSPGNVAWTERAKSFETVGQSGVNSCSPVGAGGATGCMQKLINQAYAERKQSSDVRFGKIIEEEREKRLSTIDKDAAAEQARVEELEKEYEAKKAAADGTAPPAPDATPAPASDAGKSKAPLSTPPGD